jgi:cellulose synthase operon protein YhjQ
MPLIAFASPKGGVGKTTLAAHAAALLARAGHRVVALDLDPQNALRLHLGLDLDAPGAFGARLAERPAWREALVETPCGARLLPFGALDPARAMELAQALWREPALLAEPLREMLAVPGLVLVADTPPGPGPALAALQPHADLQVLVLLADAGSAAMLPQIANNRQLGRGTLAARAAERAVVVLNQVENGVALSDAVLEMAEQALGPRLLGVVCRDEALAEALADRRMLLEGEAGAGEDLQLMAEALAKRLRLPGAGGGRTRAEPPGLFDWGRM